MSGPLFWVVRYPSSPIKVYKGAVSVPKLRSASTWQSLSRPPKPCWAERLRWASNSTQNFLSLLRSWCSKAHWASREIGPSCSKHPFKQLWRYFQAGNSKFSISRAAGQKRWPTQLSLAHHGERVPPRQGITDKLLMPVDMWLGKCSLFTKGLVLL